jgi:hypothetical protein
MKVKGILFFILLVVLHFVSFSQINDIIWQKCFGTQEMDNPYCIEKITNGYLVGVLIITDDTGVTNYHDKADIWILNIDSLGNVIWERCYGGSEGDGPEKIIPIDDENIYLLNNSISNDGDVQNGKPADFWIVKINGSGSILWENSYGNRTCDVRDALLTPDGGLLMMGRILAAGGDVKVYYGGNDIWLCKIDSIGNIQWEKTFGNEGQDNAVKIKLTSDATVLMIGGHYISGGMIDCPDLGNDGADVWIVEIDLDGNILNQWCYGGSLDDVGFDIIELEQAYVFTAATSSNDIHVSGLHGVYDIWVVKIDKYGNIIWQKCLGGSSSEYPRYLTQTEDEGFIIMGNTTSDDGDISFNHSHLGYMDIWVVKLDSVGELEWEHCFGGVKTERFLGIHTVLKKSDYNYVLAGQSDVVSGDVECDLYGIMDEDAWILEIKDCSLYMPQTPNQPTGPDTLCYTTDSTSMYAINTATGAWGYEWKIEPENAGTLLEDTLTVYVTWNQQYEGEVAVSVRSFNDCGNSDWSAEKTTWVYNCVGIKEINTAGYALKVYPNPVNSKFEIRCSIFEIQNTTIEIFDLMGSKIKEMKITKGQEKVEVDVKGWRKGLYLVKASNGKNYYGIRKVLIR